MVEFTPLQLRVIEMRAAQLTRHEIAVELGVSDQAVKKHFSRARKRAVRQQPALERYARALSRGGRPVRFKPFSLLPGEA